MQLEAVAASLLVMSVPVAGTYPPAARWFTRAPGLVLALLIATLVAIAGLTCAALEIVQTRFAVASVAPVVQIGIVKLARGLFIRTQGREPVDVVFNFSPGLAADRFFAFVVGVGGIVPFLFLLAPR
jgi:hypothetical protein